MRDPFTGVSEVNILGAFFPGWILSIALGIVLSLVVRVFWVRTGLAPHIGPPVLIYPCLVLLFTFGSWIILFSG